MEFWIDNSKLIFLILLASVNRQAQIILAVHVVTDMLYYALEPDGYLVFLYSGIFVGLVAGYSDSLHIKIRYALWAIAATYWANAIDQTLWDYKLTTEPENLFTFCFPYIITLLDGVIFILLIKTMWGQNVRVLDSIFDYFNDRIRSAYLRIINRSTDTI